MRYPDRRCNGGPDGPWCGAEADFEGLDFRIGWFHAVAGKTIANRAAGYDMPGVAVDGQSALDMYEVAGEAVKRARAGEGPTLVEAQTYRYTGHFTADNPLSYRLKEEEEHFRKRDCIDRLRNHLLANGVATAENLSALDKKALDDIAEATRFADESPFPEPEDLYADVYISYP